MTDLIDRIEAATGADRELDAAIFAALNPHMKPTPKKRGFFYDPIKTSAIAAQSYHISGGATAVAPLYSASIDAAMGLVLEGMSARLYCEGPQAIIVRHFSGAWREVSRSGLCTTPALALCAAALKARESEG